MKSLSAEKQYIELYDSCSKMICRHSSDVMNAPRKHAYDILRRQGFPSKKVERYKYTDIEAVFAPDYGVNLKRLNIPVNPYDAFKCDVPNLSTSLYFVVNDRFYTAALPKASLPEGVVFGSLQSISAQKPELVERYYNKIADNSDSVTALNTMLAQDGVFLYVPKNVRVGRAIQIINIMRSDVDLMANRRMLIVLEEGAEAELLICDHTIDNRKFLATQVTEAFVGANASLNIYGLEETNTQNSVVNNSYIELQANSRLFHNMLTLHNGLTRNTLNLTLSGEGAECECNGCAIIDKEQHVDNNTLITHAASHCQSRELYKYVLNDSSTGAFAGRVLVKKDAQKTESEMKNQNICATKQARMYTQPMLEIYADDVKCSHGCTVGQIDDAALFYMRQRGVSLEEAKQLLQIAFASEVIGKIKILPMRNRLQQLVEKRFRDELNKCGGCSFCRE